MTLRVLLDDVTHVVWLASLLRMRTHNQRSQQTTAVYTSKQCLFGASWGGESPPKKITIPLYGCQIVCSNPFLGRYNELQIYHGNFLLMDNKHRKLFVISNQKDANICLKCTEIHLPAGTRLVSLCALPDLLAVLGAYL